MNVFKVESPEESGPDDSLLVEWAAELAGLVRAGEPVDLGALSRQYPERACALRSLVPAIALMAELGSEARRGAAELDPFPTGPDRGDDRGRLGDYRLIREVGRGGMGIVYEAEQISLGRRVALKVLPFAAALDARQVQRFHVEAQAAAFLHHTHIVPVHAVGCERGVHYYAMQLIEGRTLADVIRELRRADGLEPVDPAPTDHLASRLAAHLTTRSRLMTEPPPGPEPGSSLGAPGPGPEPGSSLGAPGPGPEPGSSLGAPGPSPCDCRVPAASVATLAEDEATPGSGSSSSTRGRAYFQAVAALGRQAAEALEHAHQQGVLHRDIKPANLMLDGRGHLWITDFGLARFDTDPGLTITGDVLGTLRYMSPEQALARRVVIDQRTDVYSLGVTLYELLTLRAAFSGQDRAEIRRQIAESEPRPLRRVNPAVPADLETIVLKAMAKVPADRYTTAGDLAADLGRFLENRTILARRPSLSDRGAKWLRRHRGLVVTAAAALIMLALGLLGAGLLYTVSLKRYNAALQVEVERADRNAEEAKGHASEADRQRTLADRHYFAAQLQLAGRAIEGRQFEVAQDLIDEIDPRPAETGEFAWHYLRRLARRELVRLRERPAQLKLMTIAGDRRTAAAWYNDDNIVLWDLDSERAFQTIDAENCRSLVLSEDGKILGAIHDNPGVERFLNASVWETNSGRPLGRFPTDVRATEGPSPSLIRLLARGRIVALGTHDANTKWTVHLYDLQSGSAPATSVLPRVKLRGLDGAYFSAGLDFFVSREGDLLRVRDGVSGEVRKELPGVYRNITDLTLSADGRYLAAAPAGDPVVVVNLATETVEARHSFGTQVALVVLSADGGVLCGVDASGVVHLWDRRADRSRVITPDELKHMRRPVHIPVLSADGRRMATHTTHTSGGLQPLAVWDVETGLCLGVLPSPDREVQEAAFSSSSRTLIAGGTRSPRIWHFDPPPDPPSPAGHKAEAWAAAYSPDSQILATGSDDTDEPQTIKLWNPATAQLIRGWHAGEGTVASLSFSPDGRTLASGHIALQDNVRIWDVATGRLLHTFRGHRDTVRSIAFAPDGRTLASAGEHKRVAGEDGTIRVWDVAAAICVRELSGHTERVRSLAFSPDGQKLASASNDTTVRLWDTGTGRLLKVQRSSTALVALAFAPDGRTIMVADDTGLVTVRDAASLAILKSIRGESDKLLNLAVAPDGSSVAICGVSGAIHLWGTLTGQEMLSLPGHKAQVNGIAFAPDGSSLASCSHDGGVKLWRTR